MPHQAPYVPRQAGADNGGGSIEVPVELDVADIEEIADLLALFSNASAGDADADARLAEMTGLGDRVMEWPPVSLATYLARLVCTKLKRRC